jgi:hypothetical protein
MFGLSGRQIVILLIFVVLLFAGSQYVPAYFASFQFKDYIRQQVKYAGTSRKTAEALRSEITQKAKELGIPLAKDAIKITKRGLSFNLEVQYSWHIDLKVYEHDLFFTTSENGELFENASN